MVFINNAIDFTLTPSNKESTVALLSSAMNNGLYTFEQAANINRIYQGNGLICQTKMCKSLTGCDNKLANCPGHPDWNKVLNFCGPIDTRGIAYDGAEWVLRDSDSRQSLLTATKQQTGLQVLPTPYNVTGMY